MWIHEPVQEELPPFILHLPGWMAARHEAVKASCERLCVSRFAYGWPLTATGGETLYEIYENVDGEWTG